MNYRFLTTETNLKKLLYISLFVYNLISSECTDFFFTIVFFEKRENNTHQTFHILKMKAHFKKEPLIAVFSAEKPEKHQELWVRILSMMWVIKAADFN